MNPKTLDMEVAIMEMFDITVNTVVTNVHWGMSFWERNVKKSTGRRYGCLHECDVLSLTPAGYATEVEIKVSRQDLLKDKEKKHNHDHIAIKFLYFAVPEKLKEVALAEIPERAGLILVRHTGFRWKAAIHKKAKQRTDCLKWDDKEHQALLRLGNLRVLNLKKKIQKLRKKL